MIQDLLKRGRSTEAENLARALLSRIEITNGRDSLEVAQVLDLLSETLRLRTGAKEQEKKEFAERAVAIKEQKLGPEHPDLAASLANLAIQRTLAGDPAGGKPLLERALVIREKAFGSAHLSVAATMHSLAGIHMMIGDDAGAKVLLEQALRIREKVFGADHPEVGRLLFSIAGFYGETNDYLESQRLYARALGIQEKAFGPDHPITLSTLTNLAVAVGKSGDSKGSARLNERLLASLEKRFGPTDPRLTFPLHNLALDLIDLGEYEAAKRLAGRALAIHERAAGPNHPAVADSLHTLATAYAELGNYGEALGLFERSIRIREEAFPRADSKVGRALAAIPALLRLSGDIGEGNELFERALAMRERSQGLGDPVAANSLNTLAAALSTAEDYARAKPLFERALTIQERALGPDHPQVAGAAKNLADVLVRNGDRRGARALYERALLIWENALGGEHPKVATALLGLARVHLTSGNASEAKAQLERAYAIQQKALGAEHPDLAVTLSTLAELHARTGNGARALELAAQAETISREHLRLAARLLPERQALAYASVRTSALDLMLSLASEQSADVATSQLAWNAAIRARGLILEEMVSRHRVAGSTHDSEIGNLADVLTAARQHLSSLVVRGVGDDTPEQYRRFLERARRDKEQAERTLADKSAKFREEQSKNLTNVDDLSAALPAGSALVAFVKYQYYASPSYLAFVLRSGNSSPIVRRLGSADHVDNLVLRWRQQLEHEAMAPGRASRRMEASYRRVAAELREQIWDPLVPHLRLVNQVFIVPDGALHLVSVAALPVGASQYLLETGPLLHYLSVERDVVQLLTERPQGNGLFVLADPEFGVSDSSPAAAGRGSFRGSISSCTDLQSMRFDPIPASAREATQVAKLWIDAVGGESVDRLVGPAADESAFKRTAPGHQVVHVATHGFFAERCAPSTEDPLLFSGLALAGANDRAVTAANQEDGILTAEEIAALNFTGVAWVVLSGCDTGVGQIRSSEGVFGLTRAFRIAGAATIIMSLWPVDDTAAQQWMQTLYEQRLRRRAGTAEAVRAASLSMLRQQRSTNRSTHPFYWASFVASGDWR